MSHQLLDFTQLILFGRYLFLELYWVSNRGFGYELRVLQVFEYLVGMQDLSSETS